MTIGKIYNTPISVTQISTEVCSPCVSHCALDNDDICLGCYRHIDEIVGWRHLDHQGKEQVLERCKQRQQSKH